MSTFRLSDQTRVFRPGAPLRLESGEQLPDAQIAFRTWGRLSARADNAVIVCHALTGSADADDWWAPLFGAGRALDPERDFIVCSNVLGGCYGSTGPTSPAPDGRPWGARFPRVTIRDQVHAQILLADALGIRRIRLVIGGSMGGLQALEWALLDPDRVDAVASVAAAARHSPWCMAWSEAQRLALAADPKYRDGRYPPADPPVAGLAAARAMAMVSYRSPGALASRFSRNGDAQYSTGDGTVQGWLRHHGQALTRRFDANSYRVLLDAMDTHDLGRGRGGCGAALANLHQPVLVGSVTSDALYVPEDQFELATLLPRATLVAIDSPHGHDGFLIDAARFEPALRRFTAGIAPRHTPQPVRRAAPMRPVHAGEQRG
ncbi:homoserine O-acetyltransferase [uncultured Zoogloea sp.]|uniref:homoserine O-acetyltransferase MetX n=1 Tax=uncultured Zoogloea sp. TaxID=160237 RepID=UPI00262B1643|nr:homoserine O-acetyltransferase [uncultured Zoogloea sp.]